MTAHVGPGAREKCLAAGMDDYLSKPLIQGELDRALRTWCAMSRSGLQEMAPLDPGLQGAEFGPVFGRTSQSSVGRESAPPEPIARDIAPPSLDARLRVTEPDIVAEFIALFLTEAPARIVERRHAASRGSLGEVGRLAWALHENADRLAALTLKDLCARIDREARAGTLQRLMEAVQGIEREVERVQGSLAAELKKRGRG